MVSLVTGGRKKASAAEAVARSFGGRYWSGLAGEPGLAALHRNAAAIINI
jgi:hypothetical protein